jgi:hypothetical protein
MALTTQRTSGGNWRWLVVASLSVWPIYLAFGWLVGYTRLFDGVGREALGWTILGFDLVLILVSVAIVVACFRRRHERPAWVAAAAAFPAGLFAAVFTAFFVLDIFL